MKKRILLVDDDPQMLNSIKAVLEENNYVVTPAMDARTAQQIFTLEKFDIVLSDINMPQITGLQLAHFIRNKSQVPVVLMTGLKEYIDSIDSYQAPINGFIPKPFKKEDLLNVLSACFPGEMKSIEERENLDTLFSKLSIDEFVAGKQINYDIFIRLSEAKYVKIAYSGEDIEMERIKAYRNKKLLYFYLKKEDFAKYVGFSLQLTKALKKSTIDQARKLQFLKFTGEVILENISINGMDEAVYDDAKTFLENTVSMISDDEDALGLLEALNAHGDFLYSHSVAVSFYSLVIARAMGWTSASNRMKIALAGLFHDIGKKEIDRDILLKARRNMNLDEIKIYEEHSTRGVEILREVSSMSGDVLQIVMHHHENCIGTGFPGRIKQHLIHPLAKLIAVADEMAKLTVKGPESQGKTPLEAVAMITNLYSDVLDSKLFPALKQVFKIKS